MSSTRKAVKRRRGESLLITVPAKKARLEEDARAESAQAADQLPSEEISDDGVSLLASLRSATSLPAPAHLPVPSPSGAPSVSSTSSSLFKPKPIIKRVEDLETILFQLKTKLAALQSNDKEYKNQLGM